MNHKIIQWNCRGIKANRSELLLLMTQQQPAIVCLQETFLKTNDDITIKKHQSYNFINNTGHNISFSRCSWCNGYCRRIWTRRHEFKSWTWLIAFHIALIPLGKVWIQIFSLQLWVNSRTDWVLQPWWDN